MGNYRPGKKYEYCDSGKVIHKSELAAEWYMNALLKSVTGKDKDILQIYRCETCGHLHVGRKRK